MLLSLVKVKHQKLAIRRESAWTVRDHPFHKLFIVETETSSRRFTTQPPPTAASEKERLQNTIMIRHALKWCLISYDTKVRIMHIMKRRNRHRLRRIECGYLRNRMISKTATSTYYQNENNNSAHHDSF